MGPTGKIVVDWSVDQYRFRVEKLNEPRIVGAGMRYYRLWEGDYPSSGGQWHYTADDAIERAKYVAAGTYERRIATLLDQVNKLQAEVARLKIRLGEHEH